eukprot:240341-Chlamydomonas_euryale.AAC.25
MRSQGRGGLAGRLEAFEDGENGRERASAGVRPLRMGRKRRGEYEGQVGKGESNGEEGREGGWRGRK